MFIALGLACMAFATAQPCYAEKRAFVYGVDHYKPLPRLAKALEDAEALSNALREMGYRVDVLRDADRAEFDRRWTAFLNSLKPGDVVVFFFAGHGIQLDGANYLLPRDTPTLLAGQHAIIEKALNVHQLMEELQVRQPAASIYILDACRDNPFAETEALKKAPKKSPSIAQAKGLALMESVYGTFVMYSAGPNETALDYLRDPGRETNSVFTRHLLRVLRILNLTLVDLIKRVQVLVQMDARTVGHTQRPVYFDGILGSFYLNQLVGVSNPLGPSDRPPAGNVVRLAGFATWDDACRSRHAPLVKVVSAPPKFGRIVTRFETFDRPKTHFGNSCEASTQRGIGVYYVIDEVAKNSKDIETVELSVKHWSVSPVTSVKETFAIDLATGLSKRTTAR